MQFLIIPLDKLKQFDSEWEYRRRNNDGTKAIIHKEIYDEYFPQPKEEIVQEEVAAPQPRMMKAAPRMATMAAAPMAATMSTEEEPQEPKKPNYPYPLVSGEELDAMDEFKSVEPTIEER